MRERPAGTFARQLTLGQGLAVDRIQADYADGVLTLTIRLAEESKPHKIQVTASGGQKTIEQGGQQGSAEGSGQAQ
ncbi:Hsp20/alpha crystallin family protein [Ornithinimicrobium sufpigmenti]|uniref:Hsp20/alpha crystallin family protein n=1 Tax=Ornithinimicrobium sufpigmenti TaxID=2508882 RepID=UPI00307B6F69